MGARISGVGTGVLRIDGVESLCGVEYTIMPDRLDIGSIAMLTAATQGNVSMVGANFDHLGVARAKLEQMGVEFVQDGPVIHVRAALPLRPINVITWLYPGFATDLQPQMMALTCLAAGRSYLRETIFNERFSVMQELAKMGAQIEREGDTAVVRGPARLVGSTVYAHDLRAGQALLLAGAAAEGETIIENAEMIER